MNQFRVFVLVAMFFGGCAPNCEDDDTCQRQCPENTWAACTEMNLCRCESFQDVMEAGALKLMEVCRDPEPAELMISEVLVDGEPTEDQEFIEIRNMSGALIRLDGVSLHVKRGQQMRKSIGINTGCVPPGGLILLSAQEVEPVISPEWQIKPTYEYRRFAYSNSADFIAELLLFDQVVLDSVALDQARIIPGVSLVREFNTDSDLFVDHRSAGRGRSSSPGLCSDGSEAESGCMPTLVHCSVPMPRELVINEVLIDAAPESGEFIELVNQTEHSLDLSGISLHTISRGVDTLKLKVWSGCLPAGETVAFFAKASDVLARDDTLATLQFEVQRFHFPNGRTTRFELRNEDQTLLDAFLCPASQIEESVSLNRYPDVSGWLVYKHTQYFDTPSSPGLRARTTTYEPPDH